VAVGGSQRSCSCAGRGCHRNGRPLAGPHWHHGAWPIHRIAKSLCREAPVRFAFALPGRASCQLWPGRICQPEYCKGYWSNARGEPTGRRFGSRTGVACDLKVLKK
jgi:hypothetical protein